MQPSMHEMIFLKGLAFTILCIIIATGGGGSGRFQLESGKFFFLALKEELNVAIKIDLQHISTERLTRGGVQ